MNRPTGVTVISILYFLSATFWLLLALGLFVGGGLAGMAAGAAPGEGAIGLGILAGAGVAGGVAALLFAAVMVMTGVGLLRLRNWGRILAIVLSVVTVCVFFMGVIFLEPMSIITVALNIWIIVYLLKPPVKAAFGAA